MKTNINLKSTLVFIGLLLSFYISANIYNVNQATGSFSVLNNDYTDGLNHTWNINIGTLQKVNIYYSVDTEMDCDYFEIYDVDVNNNCTLLASYSGAEYGNITTTSMSGKVKIIFYTDGSICGESGYTGITFSFISNDNVESISKNLKVLANSNILGDNIVIGNTGLGITNPEEKLHINGNIRGNANGGALRVNTQSGYLDLGSMNGGFAHIYTDRPYLISNAPIWSIPGTFSAYQTSDLKLQTNGTTRMTVSATTGNVGINTTTPKAKFEILTGVNAPPAATGTNQTGGALRLRGGDNAVLDFGINSVNSWIQATDQTALNVNYNLSLNPNGGNVGIGTISSPSEKLTVAGGHGDTKIRLYSTGNGSNMPSNLSLWASEPGLTYQGTGIGYNVNGSPYYGRIDNTQGSSFVRFLPGETKFQFQNAAGSNVEALTIKETGNIGINTNNPIGKFDIQTASNQHIQFVNNVNGAFPGCVGIVSINDINNDYTPMGFYASKYYFGNGKVGIGTTTPDQMLTVNGTIHAKEVLVDMNILADYVFSPDYSLMPLHKVEAFVKTNKHLPEIPSAAEVKEKGLSMGEMQNKLLQKIEELTLYVIELQKTNEKQSARIEELETKIK